MYMKGCQFGVNSLGKGKSQNTSVQAVLHSFTCITQQVDPVHQRTRPWGGMGVSAPLCSREKALVPWQPMRAGLPTEGPPQEDVCVCVSSAESLPLTNVSPRARRTAAHCAVCAQYIR